MELLPSDYKYFRVRCNLAFPPEPESLVVDSTEPRIHAPQAFLNLADCSVRGEPRDLGRIEIDSEPLEPSRSFSDGAAPFCCSFEVPETRLPVSVRRDHGLAVLLDHLELRGRVFEPQLTFRGE